MRTEPIVDRREAYDGEAWCGLENGLSRFDGLCCDRWITPSTTVDVAGVSVLSLAVVCLRRMYLLRYRDQIGGHTLPSNHPCVAREVSQ